MEGDSGPAELEPSGEAVGEDAHDVHDGVAVRSPHLLGMYEKEHWKGTYAIRFFAMFRST